MIITSFVIFLSLSLLIACVTRTITQEEIFRELRDYAYHRMLKAQSILARKVYYPLTCEYCFSHWTTMVTLAIFPQPIFFAGWKGYLLSFFVLTALANFWLVKFENFKMVVKFNRQAIKLQAQAFEQQQFFYTGKKRVEERQRILDDRQWQKIEQGIMEEDAAVVQPGAKTIDADSPVDARPSLLSKLN